MSSQSKKKNPRWLGFANIDIPEGRREQARAYFQESGRVEGDLQAIISDNYKLSLSLNPTNDTITCTATCNDHASPNAGYSMSGYGKDWLHAVGSLLYKHYKIAACDWTGYTRGDLDDFS